MVKLKLFLLGLLGFALSACGGGTASAGESVDVSPRVTSVAPSTIDSECPTAIRVMGTGFSPVGGTATIRLAADAGTPFSGGTARSIDVAAVIESETLISGRTLCCGVSHTVPITCIVALPGGEEVTSAPALATIVGPTITGCEPGLILTVLPKQAVVAGTGFGGSATARFTAVEGTPFLGGSSATLEIPVAIDSPTQLHFVTPALASDAQAQATLALEFSSGARAVWAPAVTFQPQCKLEASDATADDRFGYAVAISGDTAVVGAPHRMNTGDGPGRVLVFVREAGTWVEQQELTASDAGAGDGFGHAVAISADTLIIGAKESDDHGEGSGSAYVFVRSGGTWTEQQKLTASDAEEGDRFGLSVAISGDTAAVGSPGDDDGGLNVGSAYVYTRSGATWSEEPKLTPPDGEDGDYFGISIAVSDGTVVVGAGQDDDDGDQSGSAYVFVNSEGTWVEQQKLTAWGARTYDYFGWAVAVSGNTLVVGAPGNSAEAFGAGAAFVFGRSDGVWVQQAQLVASDPDAGDDFGDTVGISGTAVVVGANANDNVGAAYVFTRSDCVWLERAKLTAADGAAEDTFGHSVAISGDTVVVGAWRHDAAGTDSGAAYLY